MMKHQHKLSDNAGAAWLKARGGDIATQGIGYTNDLRFDRSKVRTNATEATKIYLNRKHGKAGR